MKKKDDNKDPQMNKWRTDQFKMNHNKKDN